MGLPNTTGIELNEFPPIEADWYELVLESSEEKTSKKRNKYTKLTFKIEGQPGKAWGNISHVEDALWKIKQFKQAIGMLDDESELGDYIGSRLEGWCQNREYEGKNYTEVTEYRALDSESKPTPASKDDDSDLPF